MRHNNLGTGIHYFTRGFQLALTPGLRVFILVPILVNMVLFVILTTVLANYFDGLMTQMFDWLPGWLHFLAWIFWLLFAVILLVVYGFSFATLTNIIAAPFYGLLAQKTEEKVTGRKLPNESLAHMIPRVFSRELSKLLYFLPRSLGFFILGFFFAPILLIWGAWSMAVQYADYAPDNHQLNFTEVRRRLSQSRWSSFGFGGCVLGCSMVPVLNIIAMPVAVIGGTLFWVEELHGKTPY